jgi:glycosyltransferase involved in cell wall biosynthesis
MKILHVMPALYPIHLYGGAERAAYNLAKALAEMGHENYFMCLEGSKIPFAKVIEIKKGEHWQTLVPPGIDIVQLYNTPTKEPEMPYLVCIQGNGRAGEKFLPNTVFLSENHAKRHHWSEFVYNGIDPSEYPLGKTKRSQQLLFLAKASWVVKNLFGAMDLAAQAQCKLKVCGGSSHFYYRFTRPHVEFLGMVGGMEKLKTLQESEALLFPVIWDEPFGIAVIEALACGTPVIATPRGSLPEIVDSSCGMICHNQEEFLVAISKRKDWQAESCRKRVLDNFTHHHQAEKYLFYYEKILKQKHIRDSHPYCSPSFMAERIYPIPRVRMSLKAQYKYLKQKESLMQARALRQLEKRI